MRLKRSVPTNVAALQFSPILLDAESNLSALSEHLAACDAELVVMPELCTSGYFFADAEELAQCAEPADGTLAELLRDTALARRMILVAGFAEEDGGRFFNSALTVLPDGSLRVYRKVHLFGREKLFFTPGDGGFPVVEWDRLVLGTMICYDWRFPEALRTLALKGAQIVCHPSDLVAAPRLWQPVMRTRAFENRVITITANRNGTETRGDESLTFHGCSQITDVNGDVLAETGEETVGWISADIDASRALNKRFSRHNDIFSDRRPEAYEL